MKNLTQALSLVCRRLLKSPGFSFLAILMVAVGVGATTAIFSVVDGALLQPLPVAEPDRLVRLQESQPAKGWDEFSVAEANYLDWRRRSRVFDEMGAIAWQRVNLSGGEGPERAQAARVSAGLLPMLGVVPTLGRHFLAEEEQPGSPRPVALLSAGLWERRFAADPKVLGKTLTVDGQPHEIVGVATLPLRELAGDLFLPLAANPAAERDNHELEVLARLRPGATLDQARAEMTVIASGLATEYPATNQGWTVKVSSLFDDLVDAPFRRALAVLTGGVLCLLLVACANLASLLLARSSGRSHELALRAALGAGRSRLVGHLLVEALAVGLLGGGAGLLLALWGVDLLKQLDAGSIPRLDQVEVDGRVLLFSLGLSLLAGLLAGLIPALRAAGASPRKVLAEAGPALLGGRSERRLRAGLVVLEVALSLVLLVGSGLLLRSHRELRGVEAGFAIDHRLTLGLSLPEDRYPTPQDTASLFSRLLERLEAVPGVKSAAAVSTLPFGTFNTAMEFELPDHPVDSAGPPRSAAWRLITPRYFETLGIPLLAGRAFTAADHDNAPEVAIISQRLAELHFPGENPVGRRIASRATVVGVVGDVRERSLATAPASMIYFPFYQARWSNMPLVLHLSAPADVVLPGVRAALAGLDRDLPLAEVRPLAALLDENLAPRRFHLVLLTIFAALALLLAIGGLYGVLSGVVAERRREIGIRVALGADTGQVVGMVARWGLGLTGLGLALGLLVAAFASKALSSLLFGVEPLDLGTYAGVALLLAAVGALASAVPAFAAGRVDPREALKSG